MINNITRSNLVGQVPQANQESVTQTPLPMEKIALANEPKKSKSLCDRIGTFFHQIIEKIRKIFSQCFSSEKKVIELPQQPPIVEEKKVQVEVLKAENENTVKETKEIRKVNENLKRKNELLLEIMKKQMKTEEFEAFKKELEESKNLPGKPIEFIRQENARLKELLKKTIPTEEYEALEKGIKDDALLPELERVNKINRQLELDIERFQEILNQNPLKVEEKKEEVKNDPAVKQVHKKKNVEKVNAPLATAKELIGEYAIKDLSKFDRTILVNGVRWLARWPIEWKKGDQVSIYQDQMSDKGQYRFECKGKYNYCSRLLGGKAKNLAKTIMTGQILKMDRGNLSIQYQPTFLAKKAYIIPTTLRAFQLIPSKWEIGDEISLVVNGNSASILNNRKYDSVVITKPEKRKKENP